MEYVIYILAIILFIWCFWALYVFAMGVYRAHLNDKLYGLNKIMAMPIIALAYLVDIFANLTLATIIFLDLPKETLVTSRLQRYMAGNQDSWRYKLAKYVCDHMLDIFDPNGNHC